MLSPELPLSDALVLRRASVAHGPLPAEGCLVGISHVCPSAATPPPANGAIQIELLDSLGQLYSPDCPALPH